MSAVEEQSLLSAVLGFFVPTAQCEAPAPEDPHSGEAVAATSEENNANEDSEEQEEAGGADEEEEEEPEDIAPQIREECKNSKECAPAAHHFQACADKVEAGKGWQGEDCVEELFHMMHCVDACAAPRLFKRLV
ncbi:ubiquinol--cytochrome-c reductase subunit 6 [Naganishia albida]|nr:ubiquinol--cytochrome-c reductase subunit 6 [Naganishia albida]